MIYVGFRFRLLSRVYVFGRAGATSSVNCSVCQAGSYMYMIYVGFIFLLRSRVYVFVTGRAGATARVNCSMCQEGSYGTGSGEGWDWALILVSSHSMLVSCLLYEL